MKDISRKLGLSVTQVSRALNGHSDVNEETRQRVMETAKALKYQPNLTARKLVSGRSGMVGFVMTRYPRLSSDGFLLEMMAGLSSQFSSRGMQFVLHIAQEGDDVIDIYQKLIDGGALDGFIIVEPVKDDVRVRYLAKRGVPFVVHGRTSPTPSYPFFDIDNYGVAYQATAYLGRRGHKHIALINGPEHYSFARDRLAGYRSALAERGLTLRRDLIRHGRMDEGLGLVSTVQFFSDAERRPSAVICGNVLIAQGVYKAVAALGLSIPHDVSIIAHDDVLPDFSVPPFRPELTVTRAALRDSWSPLADYLAGAIQGKPPESLQCVTEFEFVEGGSVASLAS
ncbi:MAG: substrate-binding domain-containing protein [Ensifer alkalisoli]|nr:substrate-binding domain-containing protein [Sinorhizobium alkalisoli]